MCLPRITNWHKKDSGVGWKMFVYDKKRKKLFTPFMFREISIGRWEKSGEGKIYLDCGLSYSSGFHIFRFKKEAIAFMQEYSCNRMIGSFILKKVKYRKVVCSGIEKNPLDNRYVVVAREMFVLPEVVVYYAIMEKEGGNYDTKNKR